MKKSALALLALLAAACSSVGDKSGKPRIAVSIAPIEWIVSGLADSMAQITIIVPPGTSPETYEPTARQIEELHNSQIVFSIGLIDFEQQLEHRLEKVAHQAQFVRLADSLALIEGSCSHHESHTHAHTAADPHVWLSPPMIRRMTGIAAQILVDQKIDEPSNIFRRRDSLYRVIDKLDSTILGLTQRLPNRTFAIVHPSLGYFANHYNLRQMAIEIDGKEPSGQRIKALIDTMRANQITTIIYSNQDPASAARAIADQIGGTISPFDPMALDWPTNMLDVAQTICNTH